ncbi:MAG TPA: hypothetical protein VE890_17375 [Thermoguttaceae bacterium]|nr:hypothetical protein [Thermoguttaceae bacterium]
MGELIARPSLEVIVAAGSMTERIQLTPDERELILRHGHPFDRLSRALRRHSPHEAIRRISMSAFELDMLIGELSRSFNHGQCGQDEDAIIALCERLEYAQQTGDGDLDILQ